MTRRTGMAMVAVAAASAGASADFIYQDAANRPARDFIGLGFESIAAGSTMTALDFGDGVVASVSTTGNISNQIFSQTDGYGAVAAEGDRFWKLAGGTTTIDFGTTALVGLEFIYSDLEWATLVLQFDNGAEVWLTDSNSGQPRLFGYSADAGNPFSSVSITWRGTQNDGVGFDVVQVATIPSPGTGPLFAAAGLLAIRRRRTRSAAA